MNFPRTTWCAYIKSKLIARGKTNSEYEIIIYMYIFRYIASKTVIRTISTWAVVYFFKLKYFVVVSICTGNNVRAYLVEQPRAEYDLEKIISNEQVPELHRFAVGHKSRPRDLDGEHVRSAYECRGQRTAHQKPILGTGVYEEQININYCRLIAVTLWFRRDY